MINKYYISSSKSITIIIHFAGGEKESRVAVFIPCPMLWYSCNDWKEKRFPCDVIQLQTQIQIKNFTCKGGLGR